jgi:UDP-N-acetylmuramoyl-tripeptide--D-alanyl-D-alanine ligase
MQLPLPGRHNISNFMAAAMAALAWGLTLEEIAAAATEVRTEAHRNAVLHFEDGFTIVDDTYNSNPKAMACMLELMRETGGYGRKILVAGEMLELGAQAGHFHAEVGRLAVRSGIDQIIGVRGEARLICRGAVEAGLAPAQTMFCETTAQAADALCALMQPSDLVLVKGSHGVGLENLIAEACRRFAQKPAVLAGGRTHDDA